MESYLKSITNSVGIAMVCLRLCVSLSPLKDHFLNEASESTLAHGLLHIAHG